MLSDIKKLDIMLGENHLEREGSEFSESIRRCDSQNFNAPENNKRTVTLILGKIDQVIVPIMAIFQLILSADFSAEFTRL